MFCEFFFPAAISAKCSITLPKVCNDLLICEAYFSLSLSLIPVLATLSLPARSTKFSVLCFLFIFLRISIELLLSDELFLDKFYDDNCMGS